MCVEKHLDELWIEAKSLTDSEIAGSPRNSYKTSVFNSATGVELLDGCWYESAYIQLNSKYGCNYESKSEYVG